MRKLSVAEPWRRFALASLLLAATLLSAPASAQITNGANAVNTNHIAGNAVGSAQIADNAVSSAQIAANSVGRSQLADGAVDTAQLANNSLNLFAGLYLGEAGTGISVSAYLVPVRNAFAYENVINSGCTIDTFSFGGEGGTRFRCSASLDLPLRGITAFDPTRVLADNAITSDDLSERSIGHRNFIQNIFISSLLGINQGRGPSHYADNGLNGSVIADDSIEADHLNGVTFVPNNGEVNSETLTSNAVETAAIADNAVTTAKLADLSVDSDKWADDIVFNTAKLGDNAVTTDKFAEGGAAALTTDKLADDAVSTAKLVDEAVTYTRIADNAVTTAKLVDGSVVKNKLAEGSVTIAKIADSAVTTAKIVDDAVKSDKLAAGAVTTAKLVDGAVIRSKFVDAVVTTAKLAAGAVTSAKFVDALVTTAKLADGAVTTGKLVDSSVTTAKIVDGAVTTAKIADAAVTTVMLADAAVTSAKIVGRTVVAGDIAFDSITGAELADGAVTSLQILDASVGEAHLDVKLVSDLAAIERGGQLAVDDAVALATSFAIVGHVSSNSGRVLATISSEDQTRIRQIVTDFQNSGTLATRHAAYSELSADVAEHIGAVLNYSALAQLEIGSRDDRLGSDWASSSLRGQTRWVRDRAMELDERVDFTHSAINRIDAELEPIKRGIAMAGAIGSTYVERGRRGVIDLSVSSFGDESGISISAGWRLCRDTQFSFATSATQDMDEYIWRFGSNIQY